MHAGTTQKCKHFGDLSGYKFGKPNATPFSGDLASSFKKKI